MSLLSLCLSSFLLSRKSNKIERMDGMHEQLPSRKHRRSKGGLIEVNRYFTVCSLQRRQQFLNLDTTTTRSRRSMTFSFFRRTSPSELFIIQCCRQQPRTAIRCRPSSIPAGVQEHARLLLLAALVCPPTMKPQVSCMSWGYI